MTSTAPRIAILGRESPLGYGAFRRLGMSTFRARMEGGSEAGGASKEPFSVHEVDRNSDKSLDAFFKDVQGLVYVNPVDRYLLHSEPQLISICVQELRRVIDCARRNDVKRIVYLSSVHTMWRGNDEPENHYALASETHSRKSILIKLEAEIYRYVAQGCDIVILNPGESLGFSFQASYLQELMAALFSKHTAPLVLPDVAIRLVDSLDVGNAVVGALKRGRTGRRYALVGAPTTTREVVASIQNHVSAAKYRRVIWGEPEMMEKIQSSYGHLRVLRRRRQWHLNRFLLDCREVIASSTRGEHELGYRIRSFQETLGRLVVLLERQGLFVATAEGA